MARAKALREWFPNPAARRRRQTTHRLALEPLEQRLAPTRDMVLLWNETAVQLLLTPGAQPSYIPASRSPAIVQAAVYEAVNAIDRSHSPYLARLHAPRWASMEAATATAAHDTLVGLYPAYQERLDAQLEDSLRSIADGRAKNWGIRVGQAAAEALLDARAHDGAANGPLLYTPGPNPGDYQLTPPNFSSPVNTHWPYMTPYTLTRADQFRPGPPPALTSAEYTAAFHEVNEIGAVDSATRTDEQTLIARFWASRPEAVWNWIAQDVAEAQGTSLAENARLFALLNFAMGDAAIGLADAKYAYNFWRPVTAIRAADTDGNPDTEPDPNWLPLLVTPAHPSYIGAHSTYTAAAATIMASFFGMDDIPITVRSDALPGATRSFLSFSAAQSEAYVSRIYGGLHWRFDQAEGEELGTNIARHAFENFLLPRRGPGGGAPAEGDRPDGNAAADPAVASAAAVLVGSAGGVRVQPDLSRSEPVAAPSRVSARDLPALHPAERSVPSADATFAGAPRKMVSRTTELRVDLTPGSATVVSRWVTPAGLQVL